MGSKKNARRKKTTSHELHPEAKGQGKESKSGSKLEFHGSGGQGRGRDCGEFRGKTEARVGSGNDGDFAAVRAEDVTGHREAESAVVGAGVKEGIEEARKIGGGKIGAGVIDDEFDAAIGAGFGAKVDGVTGRRVVDGM